MYSDVMGRVILFFQKSNREQGSLFLVIFAMYGYSKLMGKGGGGVCFFQTHCREQGSLFLVIFAMYSNVMGGGMFLSDSAEINDHCF